jgi:hypothetical protein
VRNDVGEGDKGHAENLVSDFQQMFIEKRTALSYHKAIVAIHHHSASLSADHFLLSVSCVQHMNHRQGVRDVYRPISEYALTVAHGMVMAQVTEISALRSYQYTRTVAGSLIALLATRLGVERVGPSFGNLDKLHHLTARHVLRRASGCECREIQITSRYTESGNIQTERSSEIKSQLQHRFENASDAPQFSPTWCGQETVFGPPEFRLAEYYAAKCMELISDQGAWNSLANNVQRVRRGEKTAHEVFIDPENNYWVASVHHTFYRAMSNYVVANKKWTNQYMSLDTVDKTPGSALSKWAVGVSSGIAVPRKVPSYVQTALMTHAMYSFVMKACRVISPEFMSVFGYNHKFVATIIERCKAISAEAGDETSALMLGYLLPCMMTPDVHVDIHVAGRCFHNDGLYVKMSDRNFGGLKLRLRDIIPSRHTGTIDRKTLMIPVTIL